MRVEAPPPCVIDLCVAMFQQPRVSPPGALVLMHLKRWMDGRVHASGDDGLDLQASARQGMFIVSIAIVGSDAASRREGGDKARKGFVSARVVLGHDGLARGAKGEGPAHDGAGHEDKERDPSAVRRPSPPQVTPVVACQQEWSAE